MKLLLKNVLTWFDNSAFITVAQSSDDSIDWLRITPFVLLHLACFGVIWVGVSWTAVVVAIVLYAVRVFAVAGFYHRYFAHKCFETSRLAQFVFAVLGASAAQRGPLWWVSHHRHHHMVSDQAEDVHSPHQHGFLWSHMGWFLSRKNFTYDASLVKDYRRYPELVLLDRFDMLVPALLAVSLFALGAFLQHFAPQLETNGWQLVVWGFCLSTVAVFHVTFIVNSICHKFGHRRFQTKDNSHNHWLVAFLTFGEGWHNNHHRFPCTARQGFYWWQIDVTYYLFKLLSYCGIVWNLRPVPRAVLLEGLAKPKAQDNA